MPRRRNPIRTLFKLEQLNEKSLIIIKAGSVMDNDKNRKLLATRLLQKGLKDIIIITLPDMNDFSVIDEKQMNRLGWYKKETVNEPQPA